MAHPLTFAIPLLLLGPAFGQTPEVTRLEASDADGGDNFGHAVAVSGDTAVIGAPLDEAFAFFAGSAYIKVRDGAGWSEQAKLIGSTVNTSDRFGWAVDVSGDTAVVSALFADGAAAVSGTAYIFNRVGATWSETQVLAPLDGASSDWFGRSVSVDGNTIAVGAPQDDDLGSDSGSVYVFVFNGSSWVQQAKITPADGIAFDNFGQSVSLSGDTLLIGSPFDDDRGSKSGSAYVYTRAGSSWTQEAKLLGSDSTSFDSFGYAVSLSGNRAMVGAYLANITLFGPEAGAGYIFERTAGTWSTAEKVVPASLTNGDDCGWSVAIEGDHAILSAHGRNLHQGSAFHFRNLGGIWIEQEELISSDGLAGDQFALSVNIDQERVVIGGFLNGTAASGAGAAYLYDLFRLDLSPEFPLAGQAMAFDLTGGNPSVLTWMALSTTGSGSFSIPSLNVSLDMLAPFPLGSNMMATGDGSASWLVTVPSSASGTTIWAQGLQEGHTTNLRSVTIL